MVYHFTKLIEHKIMDDELFDEAGIRSRINNVNARTVDAVMPLQGIRGRRSLGGASSGTLVPLQAELSGSDPARALQHRRPGLHRLD